jgi:hypothetical protein
MQIPIQDPATPPPPPTNRNTTTTGGRRRNNEPIDMLPPRAQPPCALCEREGHPTKRCPTLLKLRNLIQLPKATTLLATPPSTSTATTESSTTCKKGIQTNFSYAICSEYGYYTHHFPYLPQFCQTLVVVCHTSPPDHPHSLPMEAHITDIHYISSSVPKWTRYHPQYHDIWFMSIGPSPLHPLRTITLSH